MNELLANAKLAMANNRTDQPSRNFMTNDERSALAEDYAAHKDFLSAAHFTPDTEKRVEYERLFQELLKTPKT